MTVVSMNYLLESGVHFGHQKRRWNPKMKEYIYNSRDDIYIINLKKTSECLKEAYQKIKEIAENDGTFLFVGTKKQAKETIESCAERSENFYVTERWLGGTLTNFKTIRSRIKRIEEIEAMKENNILDALPKKEVILIEKEYEKLIKNLGGIRDMKRLPQALIVVDILEEENAIKEANKLNIPVFAIVDTNCDPDLVDYVIPGNDDAVRSISLILGVLTNAICEAKSLPMENYLTEEDKAKALKEEAELNQAVEKEEVVEVLEVVEEKEEVEEANLEDMTLTKLKALAKDMELKGYSTLKKQELIGLIKENR